jgi:hypothetical protein
MALMMFINGIKLFHSHYNSDNSSSGSSVISFSVNSHFSLHEVTQDKHCPICDFNLMKNADVAHSDISPFIRASGIAVFTSHLPRSLHQFSLPGKDRAPPVLFS